MTNRDGCKLYLLSAGISQPADYPLDVITEVIDLEQGAPGGLFLDTLKKPCIRIATGIVKIHKNEFSPDWSAFKTSERIDIVKFFLHSEGAPIFKIYTVVQGSNHHRFCFHKCRLLIFHSYKNRHASEEAWQQRQNLT